NFTGGVEGASDTFVSALWALDYLHWWASHGADGINFHNRRWISNCVIYPAIIDSRGNAPIIGEYLSHPIGYGLMAFALGGHGRVTPIKISNDKSINMTAYAVRAEDCVFLTIINKECGNNARGANITICAPGISGGEVMFLKSPGDRLDAKTGI